MMHIDGWQHVVLGFGMATTWPHNWCIETEGKVGETEGKLRETEGKVRETE